MSALLELRGVSMAFGGLQVISALDLGVRGTAQRDARVRQQRQAAGVRNEAGAIELVRAAGGEAQGEAGVTVLQHVDVPPLRLGERGKALGAGGQARQHKRRRQRH